MRMHTHGNEKLWPIKKDEATILKRSCTRPAREEQVTTPAPPGFSHRLPILTTSFQISHPSAVRTLDSPVQSRVQAAERAHRALLVSLPDVECMFKHRVHDPPDAKGGLDHIWDDFFHLKTNHRAVSRAVCKSTEFYHCCISAQEAGINAADHMTEKGFKHLCSHREHLETKV